MVGTGLGAELMLDPVAAGDHGVEVHPLGAVAREVERAGLSRRQIGELVSIGRRHQTAGRQRSVCERARFREKGRRVGGSGVEDTTRIPAGTTGIKDR